MSDVPVSQPYKIDLLMEQARQLASDFRESTGKSLPVGSEIALYDAARLLNLHEVAEGVAGIDLVSADQNLRFQIKSRALFGGAKSAPRIGSINAAGDWTHVLLVLMNESYATTHLYALNRETALDQIQQSKKNAMTVAKFKVLGECVWQAQEVVHNA